MTKKRGFSGDPITIWRSGGEGFRDMELAERFSFTDHVQEWVADKGRVINGASIPRALWTAIGAPFVGRYRRASIVHDVYCDDATNSRERRAADKMFYRACRADGLSRFRSGIMYIGVRFGAWRSGGFLAEPDYLPRISETLSERQERELFAEIAEPILAGIDNLALLPHDEEADELERAFDASLQKVLFEHKAASLDAFAAVHPDDKVSTALVAEDDADVMLTPDHPPLVAAGDINIGGLLIKSPCGAEDRVPVEDTMQFPHSAICYLILNGRFGTSRGTGFFVSPNTIVTAAHCLYGKLGYIRSAQIIPGRDDAQWPYQSVMARSFRVPREWRRGKRAAFDYGVIKLKEGSLGETVGHFELASLSDEQLIKLELTTAGYPSDINPSRRQHVNSGPCDFVEPQRLGYSLDTWRGASGSPVYSMIEGKPVAVGIHNYGHCPNRATRINDRVLSDINGWIAGSP